jgi:sterol desaturase/sphingolipid hydroxylase (fatty acid hydroxylase superfamily)
MPSLELTFAHALDWLTRLFHAVTGAVHDRFVDMSAPIFIVAVLVILALERIAPARPNQPILSVSFAQDVIWAFIESIGQATVLVAWVVVLRAFYQQHLDFLTLNIDLHLPSWLSIVMVLLLMDFLRWLQHLIQHKVPWFWHFHVVHHSQRHLNLFTDYRYHVFEYLVRQAVYFIPLMMLGIPQTEIFWLALILVWHARFYHGNIKTNLGPLRYVIVTPQSHRIHHSLEERHMDKNFGAFFSIWDWIFGTQYRGHREYPDTGVLDQAFPLEKSAGPISLVLTPIWQMIYPFRVIGRSLAMRFSQRKAGT